MLPPGLVPLASCVRAGILRSNVSTRVQDLEVVSKHSLSLWERVGARANRRQTRHPHPALSHGERVLKPLLGVARIKGSETQRESIAASQRPATDAGASVANLTEVVEEESAATAHMWRDL